MPTAQQTKADEKRRSDIRRLIALAGSAAYLGPIASASIQVRDQILGAMFADPKPTAGTIAGILSDARERLVQLTEASVERLASVVVEMNDEGTQEDLDLDRAFAGTGVVLDSFGHPLPLARLPKDIKWSQATPEYVFLKMSTLVVLNGELLQAKRTPLIKAFRGEVDHTIYSRDTKFRGVRSDDRLKRQKQDGYRTRARRLVRYALSDTFAAAVANQFRKGKSPAAIRNFINNRLGINRSEVGKTDPRSEGGMIRLLELIMREKSLQILEEDRQRDYENIDKSLLEGYELRSVFAETTRPSHAARDRWKFYRDNREGSSLPWSQRLIPPYAPNCLCFTRQIWGTPEPYVAWAATPRFRGAHVVKPQDVGGWTYEKGSFRQLTKSDIGRRLGKEDSPSLLVRDIGTYQTWFDKQSANVKALIVGDRRVAALQTNGIGNPTYKDFVRPDGSFLSANVLAREGRSVRRNRKRKVARAMNRQLRLQREALTAGRKLSTEQEEQYRRRLELFLRKTFK
ncbi:MAG: hypothetical protein WBN42_00475 [Ignavibacteriaceae bacterium]